MSSPCSRLGSALALATLLVASGDALAAPQDAAPAAPADGGAPLATELFNAGREMMEQGRFAEACPKLAESAKLEPRVGTLGNLADCEEKLGHLARARGYWQQAANLAKSNGDERVTHAEGQLSRLDAMVPRLKIAMPSAVPAGLVVRVDNVEVGAALIGTPIPLDPGVHAIEASAPGRTPWKADVRLPAAGRNVDVAIPDLPLVAEAGAPAPSGTAEGQTVLIETGPSPMGIVGLGATGLGVVGLGLGTYFAGIAQSRTDLSNELGCAENRCPPHAAEVRESARDAGTLATVFLLAGGGLAVGGFVTYLLAPDEVEELPLTTGQLAPHRPQRGTPRVLAAIVPDPTSRGAVGAATVSGSF